MLLNCGVGEDSLDCKEIKPVKPIGNQPCIFTEGLKLKLQYFGHLSEELTVEKTPMLGETKGRRRRG